MNMKRFRTVCNIASILLKIVTIILILSLLSSLYMYFFTERNIWFTFDIPDFSFFNSMGGPLGDTAMELAALITVPFTAFVGCYVLWKGSQLFNYLSKGHTPFTFGFAKTVKRLSLILIFTDIIYPLFYSFLVTIFMEGSHYLIIGVGSSFLIGLILYAGAEIFKYGIELQQLSDQTV